MSPSSAKSLIDKRLALLNIDDKTRTHLNKVRPILHGALDDIIKKFYSHILSFPEVKKLFPNPDMLKSLPTKQKNHWISLFSCEFDEQYVKGAMEIGKAHFEHDIAPYVYIAGNSFFQCELLKVVSNNCRDDVGFSAMLTSITKVVSLDMDLVLSFYTREYWRNTNIELIDV